jgi:hypothetical protein
MKYGQVGIIDVRKVGVMVHGDALTTILAIRRSQYRFARRDSLE